MGRQATQKHSAFLHSPADQEYGDRHNGCGDKEVGRPMGIENLLQQCMLRLFGIGHRDAFKMTQIEVVECMQWNGDDDHQLQR